MIKLKIILCCDNKYGIGKLNKLPWNIQNEMKLFKDKTIGNKNNCVIMGKNTYLSIPSKYRPLKNRINCIITKDESLKNETTYIIDSINNIENFIKKHNFENIWIIGGSLLYNSIMKEKITWIDEIHMSKIDKDYQCDVFFDNTNIDKNFKLISTDNYGEFKHLVFKNQNKDCL